MYISAMMKFTLRKVFGLIKNENSENWRRRKNSEIDKVLFQSTKFVVDINKKITL